MTSPPPPPVVPESFPIVSELRVRIQQHPSGTYIVSLPDHFHIGVGLKTLPNLNHLMRDMLRDLVREQWGC